MRTLWRSIITWGVLLVGIQEARAADGQPMLWRISDGKTPGVTGYIVGTVHTQVKANAAMDKGIWAALDEVTTVYLETEEPATGEGKPPPLKPATLQRLKARCTKEGITDCDQLTTGKFANTLVRAREDALGLDEDAGGDQQLRARARALKKSVVESKMTDPLIALLSTEHASEDAAFTALMNDWLDADLQAIPKAHAAGDDAGVLKAWTAAVGRAPNAARVRAAMVKSLDGFLKPFGDALKNGGRVMGVLNVVRVLGADGALARLQKDGWKVERVAGSGPGPLVDTWTTWNDPALGLSVEMPGEVHKVSSETAEAKATYIVSLSGAQQFSILVVHMPPDATGALLALGMDAVLAKMGQDKNVKSSVQDKTRDVWNVVALEDGREQRFVAAVRRAGLYYMGATTVGVPGPKDIRRAREERFLSSLKIDAMVGVDTGAGKPRANVRDAAGGSRWPRGEPVEAPGPTEKKGTHLEEARAALAVGALEAAITEARAAADENPEEREPLELWSACLDELRRDKEAREVSKRLSKLPKPAASDTPAPTVTFQVGETAYVSVARARVRDKADRSGKVVVSLLVNTPVRVREVSGEWIGISMPHPSREQGGYLHRSLMGKAPLEFDALLGAAKVAGERNDPLDATRALEKALLLHPVDEKTARALARNAVASGNFATAANVGVRFGAMALPRAVPGEPAVCHGCSETSSSLADLVTVYDRGKRKQAKQDGKGGSRECETWGELKVGPHAGKELMTCAVFASKFDGVVRLAVSAKEVVLLQRLSLLTPHGKGTIKAAALKPLLAQGRTFSEDNTWSADALTIRSAIYSDEAWVIEEPYAIARPWSGGGRHLFADRLQGEVTWDGGYVLVAMPDITVRYQLKRKFDDSEVSFSSPRVMAARYATSEHWGSNMGSTKDEGDVPGLRLPTGADEARALRVVEAVERGEGPELKANGMVRGNEVFAEEDNGAPLPVYRVRDPFGRILALRNVESLPPTYGEPLLYAYAPTPTALHIRVAPMVRLIASNPPHGDNGWDVTAGPHGLTMDGRPRTRFIFWEGHSEMLPREKAGVVVRGEDVASHLRKTLPTLGLNAQETHDFMSAWVPPMSQSPWVFIAFSDPALVDRAYPLEITPRADTVIRVMMDYRLLSHFEEVPPPVLRPTPTRTGVTVVEWGGLFRPSAPPSALLSAAPGPPSAARP